MRLYRPLLQAEKITARSPDTASTFLPFSRAFLALRLLSFLFKRRGS
jgi:hypothetical protein